MTRLLCMPFSRFECLRNNNENYSNISMHHNKHNKLFPDTSRLFWDQILPFRFSLIIDINFLFQLIYDIRKSRVSMLNKICTTVFLFISIYKNKCIYSSHTHTHTHEQYTHTYTILGSKCKMVLSVSLFNST